VTGLDYLDYVLLELSEWKGMKLKGKDKDKDDHPPIVPGGSCSQLQNRLNDIEICVDSLRSTYFFTLAIINRSTDFYRSAIGADLIPMKEFVNVRQIVFTSIRCIERLAIVQNSAGEGGCIKLLWKQEATAPANGDEIRLFTQDEEDADEPTCRKSYFSQKSKSRFLQHQDSRIRNGIKEDDIVFLHTDGNWLRENLLCLLSNGMKFSNNEKEVILSISYFEEVFDAQSQQPQNHKKYIRFSVLDQGVSLSDDALQKFFVFQTNEHPFSQKRSDIEALDAAIGSATGGIGLGLFALAKRIEALDGKCGVNRRNDGISGTEVWFALPFQDGSNNNNNSNKSRDNNRETSSLPRKKSFHLHCQNIPAPLISCSTSSQRHHQKPHHFIDTEEMLSSSLGCSSTSSSFLSQQTTVQDVVASSVPVIPVIIPDKPPLHCLIVDDSTAILKMLSMMLQKLGYIINTAAHGQGALDFLLASSSSSSSASLFSIDIILMDIQMPIMNGLDAMKAIRLLEKQQNIKSSRIMIIAMSANSEFSTYQDAISAGADAFLQKPFTMEVFQKTLQTLQLQQI